MLLNKTWQAVRLYVLLGSSFGKNTFLKSELVLSVVFIENKQFHCLNTSSSYNASLHLN